MKISERSNEVNQEALKKLIRKAELSRFSHSELKEGHGVLRNLKDFSIVLLSVCSAALTGLYFRGTLESDLVLTFIFLLPLVVTLVQTLDHTVFRWTERATQHGSAVSIWGNWIREADFLKNRINQYSDELAEEKVQSMQEKYISCMNNTEHVPNKKFLKYKRNFREYVLNSKNIDEMSLEDLRRAKNEY